MIDQVLKLAELNLRVHPLVERNKTPIVTKWTELASTDPDVIKRWARVNPNCNWGIATGPESGVFVVDIDPKNNGEETWVRLIADQKPFSTWTVRTGSGGTHYYFEYPPKLVIRNRRIGVGVDTRGVNGQVVAPPSIHPNGTQYAWVEGRSPWDIPLLKAPKWLVELLNTAAESESYATPGTDMENGTRNDTIFHNALNLARQGATREFTFTTMRLWCNETGNTDIVDSEIQATINSAFQSAERDAEKRKKAKTNVGKTDDDNANRLIADHGDNIAYVPGIGWHIWTNKYWKPDQEDAMVTMLAVDTMRAVYDEAVGLMKTTTDQTEFKELATRASWATASLNAGKLASMVNLASKKYRVRGDSDSLDPSSSKFLLNFQNGTLDLTTGKLRVHDKRDKLTRMVPHKYDPDAGCPTWIETLNLAFDGNTELMDFMQRAFGYTLSGSVAAQVLFICWGESGNNGKSTLLEGFSRILGLGYSQMSDMKVITSVDMDNRVSSSLARMRGARMINMNEAEDRQRLNESLVKAITGGDMVEACYKFREPFQYMPTGKLWIRTNEKPIIRSLGESMWRRVMLIPFTNVIPTATRMSRDEIDNLIDAEAEGILNWAVRGFKSWYSEGLNPPEIIQEAIREYRSEQDIIGQFFDECVVRDPGANVSRSSTFQIFTHWCRQNNYRANITAEYFGRRVNKVYNQPPERKKVGGEFVWVDIRLSNEAVINLQV
jgi:putative DNA primase/helicase